ncbi:transposase [Roseomonas sp. WA12]
MFRPICPLTPPRPWSPLTDLQWHALLPYILPRSPQGRPIADLRARMDAIFHIAQTPAHPWHALPASFGRADTVSRYFRRLTHNGLWPRLLHALKESAPNHPLRQIEYAILRATRRAARIGGPALLLLIRKLDLRTALNGPPWLLPDPLLSETCARLTPRTPPTGTEALQTLKTLLKSLAWLQKAAGGRRRIPRTVRLASP